MENVPNTNIPPNTASELNLVLSRDDVRKLASSASHRW